MNATFEYVHIKIAEMKYKNCDGEEYFQLMILFFTQSKYVASNFLEYSTELYGPPLWYFNFMVAIFTFLELNSPLHYSLLLYWKEQQEHDL